MREIELTQGYIALIDDEDYDRVSNIKWQVKKDGFNLYAGGWIGEYKKKKRHTMHRFIMGLAIGVK